MSVSIRYSQLFQVFCPSSVGVLNEHEIIFTTIIHA